MRDFTKQIIDIMKDGSERNTADILTSLGFELNLLSLSEKESFKRTFWKHQVRPLINARVLKRIDDGPFVIIDLENTV